MRSACGSTAKGMAVSPDNKINILMVDDQPAKLISYEVMLGELQENLIKAFSAREALEILLKTDIAVVIVDVCMPDLDGFQLAEMIREHPRFQNTAIIFVSAIHLADDDRLRGYRMGAVDYLPVPVVPEILRAKVKVFAELYRKTRELEALNQELETRVVERTAELENSNAQLTQSESRRNIALEAGRMGSWDWDLATGKCVWDPGQFRIFGFQPDQFEPYFEDIRQFIHPDDLAELMRVIEEPDGKSMFQLEVRITRPDGDVRNCICAAALMRGLDRRVARISGVTIDITDRKKAEEHHSLLAREVDHRAKNALALVQSIVRLTHAPTTDEYVKAIEGRIAALSHVHTLLSESRWQGTGVEKLIGDELAPYRMDGERVSLRGPEITLEPSVAQTVALVFHELATNSAKYGALSQDDGSLSVTWQHDGDHLLIDWTERSGTPVSSPKRSGFGLKVITTSVESQLRGTVAMDWKKEGLHCRLSIPVKDEQLRKAATVTRLDQKKTQPHPERQRVLLVEDEMLVGMMMQDALNEHGIDVLGPFGRLSEALGAAQGNDFSAAILDVNLAGEPVYAVAELLTKRGIPFVFATGYGRESIDTRFANVPVVHKPVDFGQLKAALATATGNLQAPIPMQA